MKWGVVSVQRVLLLIALGGVALIVACGGKSTSVPRAASSPPILTSPAPSSPTPVLPATATPPAVVSSRTPQPDVTATATTPEQDDTYLSERYEGRRIASFEEWQALVDKWEDRRPPYPGLVSFARGATSGLKAIAQLRADPASRNDKWQHCVWGSAIAAATDIATAEYHGWLKEQRDLTDGSSSSSFDEVDFLATLDGASLATEGQECEACQEICELRWGDRSKRWNGQLPPLDGE